MKKIFTGNNKGFTLTELLITIGIIATLAGLGTVGLSRVRAVNQQTKCVNNLRGISHGLQLYYNDFRMFPEDGYPDDSTDTLPLSTELAGYIPDKRTFVCPEDGDAFTTSNFSSYDPYYVARKSRNQGEELVLACPRHRNAKNATNLFSIGSTEISNIDTVLANGEEIPPDGTTAERTISNINDEMTFADGSRVKITDTQAGYGVFLIQSVRLFDGTLYSVIRVEDEGTVDVQVTSGSKFEVVTPSVIIGVRGTQFSVVTSNKGNTTDVSLTSGTVIVLDRSAGKLMSLTNGGTTETTVSIPLHSHWHWHADGTYHSHDHQAPNWAHHGNPEAGKKAAGKEASNDNDGDGYSEADGDCDESNAAIHPGATDIPGNEIDENCDGQDAPITPNDIDDDGDGFNENQGDCDDANITIHPEATEVFDGVDNDCDGQIDEGFTDADADGYALEINDCDDNNPNIHPGATEVFDSVDNDCNGQIDEGFTDIDADGYALEINDCNDNNPGIHPGAAELFDGMDNDCDGQIDEGFTDADGDGYALEVDDCNDNDPDVNPGITEVPYNEKDDDCNPATPDDDVDNDGYGIAIDCNDADASIKPGAAEIFDQADNNCNGTIDEWFTDADGDGYALEIDDCNDGNAAINPGATELSGNDIDEDCDGQYAPGNPNAEIVFRGVASAIAEATSFTIPKPSGTMQDDVMVASIGIRPETIIITPPSGWTLVRRMNNTNQFQNSLAVYIKVAGTSEPSDYMWSFSATGRCSGGILAFSGVDTTNPINVENGQSTPHSLSHSTPNVTTTVANTILVTSHTFSSTATWIEPNGMTEAFDVAGRGQTTGGSYVLQTTAGNTGGKVATAVTDPDNGDFGNTHILALRPGLE